MQDPDKGGGPAPALARRRVDVKMSCFVSSTGAVCQMFIPRREAWQSGNDLPIVPVTARLGVLAATPRGNIFNSLERLGPFGLNV